MTQSSVDSPVVRLAEVMASLSVATDLAMGQEPEFALRSCVVAVRLADSLGCDDATIRTTYYQALLRYIGCNAETSTMVALVGDEIAMRAGYASLDASRGKDVVSLLLRTIREANVDASAIETAKAIARGLLGSGQVRDIFAGHCEVAQRLAARLSIGPDVVAALAQLYERWDGQGMPKGLKGDDIAMPVQIVTLAQDAIVFLRIGGVEAATAVAKERRGTVYAPAVADRFCEHATSLLAGIGEDSVWREVLGLEPGQSEMLDDRSLDSACEAIADFADLKSSFLLGHSSGVSLLAGDAARRLGLSKEDETTIRRAGLIHDVGRAGVSTRIWDKPGPLSERDWELVRLHPYHTARVFSRSPVLKKLGDIAASHHERLDGSGYHRAIPAAMQSPMERILAVADVRQAMTEARPHRPAHSLDAAESWIKSEARRGRLDPTAVEAIVGTRVMGRRTPIGGGDSGLTSREVEVLRLLAHGRSLKDIGRVLFISHKTVDNHVQHIYDKIEVSTRAGATLYAMERGLLSEQFAAK